ncbi:hypothetical protein chiPu_0009199 [Chiloscyllium punctatum]|uniref:TNase-like domain-containing protein n=1 Tax=Chiloscyllium punctatum TaxID=137246 RepID=A0A401SK39_CHIPU|nr:hypothetical protein [Chiloscyllium punctatum]
MAILVSRGFHKTVLREFSQFTIKLNVDLYLPQITEYLNAQEAAKSARLNLWRYGDFRADDADEFGYRR